MDPRQYRFIAYECQPEIECSFKNTLYRHAGVNPSGVQHGAVKANGVRL
jgi:hypothetical protein